MGHNLNEGGRRMFYYGQRPWHGLGTELSNPATAREAIMASRLDYPIVLEKVFTENGVEILNKKATVRADTKTPFGIVGNQYQIVQNVECFDFFDSVVGEKLAIYHTAGALGDGERIWILAKLPKDIIVFDDDNVEKFLLLTTSHDGKSALRMLFTPIRAVCQNTLNMALNSAQGGISIRHTGNISDKINEARRALGLALNFYEDFNTTVQTFAKKEISEESAAVYFTSIFCTNDEISMPSTISTKKKNQLESLMQINATPEFPKARNTLWNAYNAVTRFVDHDRMSDTTDPKKRLQNIWLGSGADIKSRAYQTALVLAK